MSPAAQLIDQAKAKEQQAAVLAVRLDVIQQELMTLAIRAKAIRRERYQLLEDARDARSLAREARAADRMLGRRHRIGGEAR